MSKPRKWLRNPFRRSKKEILNKGEIAIQTARHSKERKTSFIPKYKKEWIKPEKSFKDQEEAYRTDGLLKESIDFVVDEICGNGFYVTGNLDYKEKFEGKTAIELINDFNEHLNLDEKIQIIARNLYAYGNCFLDVNNPEDFKIIPTKSIERAKIKDNQKYILKQTASYGGGDIKREDLIHLRWNVDADGVLGQGIILAMLATYNDAPDILETRAVMKEQLVEAFKKFGSPNELWALEGLPDAKIQELNNQKNEMETSGERVFVNVPGKIQTVRSERPSTYDKVIDWVESEFILIAGNPLLRIMVTPSLPPTLAEPLKDLHQRRILLLQRIIKRGIEELWRRVLKEHLFDSEEAHLRLNFGMEEMPEISIADIFTAESSGIITKMEARKMLKKYGKFELETEESQNEG